MFDKVFMRPKRPPPGPDFLCAGDAISGWQYRAERLLIPVDAEEMLV
jgi:hypothetical protein